MSKLNQYTFIKLLGAKATQLLHISQVKNQFLLSSAIAWLGLY